MLPSNCVGNTVVLESGKELVKGESFSSDVAKSGSPLAFV